MKICEQNLTGANSGYLFVLRILDFHDHFDPLVDVTTAGNELSALPEIVAV